MIDSEHFVSSQKVAYIAEQSTCMICFRKRFFEFLMSSYMTGPMLATGYYDRTDSTPSCLIHIVSGRDDRIQKERS